MLGLCFVFKLIVCKDDEIPAFSAMMKMGLHLTNWLREQNYFLTIWSSCVKICLTCRVVTFRGV